jgi:hypothetical protein
MARHFERREDVVMVADAIDLILVQDASGVTT